jgi:hypothetical protein
MNFDNMSMKSIINIFNNQTKRVFDQLYTKRKEMLRNKTWVKLNGISIIHSKYSPEQQVYALNKCQEHGIRATSRLLGVSRRTLQRWCRRYNISIPRYPPWMDDWIARKIRKRDFWSLRGY